jgi:hypothetical protein
MHEDHEDAADDTISSLVRSVTSSLSDPSCGNDNEFNFFQTQEFYSGGFYATNL